VPALLSALVNLKAQVFLAIFEPFVLTHLLFRNMLYVLSLCRAICEAQPSRRRLGFGSQLKAWIKRDEIEAKVKGLKEHVNKCYLQFAVSAPFSIHYVLTITDVRCSPLLESSKPLLASKIHPTMW
jgi:hypothetical protein